MGATKILAAVVGEDGEVLGREKRRTKHEKGSEAVINRIAKAVRDALDEAGIGIDSLRAVGLGVPGPTDSHTGIVHHAPNLGWEETPVARILTDTLGVPVFVGNDTNLCTLAEFDLGAGRGADSIIGVFVGTGVGGGIILNGDLHEGASQAAGEIGHMIIRLAGPKCGCGQRGCMEAMASRLAIERRIEQAIAKGRTSVMTDLLAARHKDKRDYSSRRIRSGMLARAYEAGDEVVVRAVNQSARLVGVALAGAVHLINPERVVIGGGVAEAIGEAYVEQVARSINDHTFAMSHRNLRVVSAALGDDAGVLGGVCLVRRRLGEAAPVS
jgi:glucokinase